ILDGISKALADVTEGDMIGSLGIDGIGNTTATEIFSRITLGQLIIDDELTDYNTYCNLVNGIPNVGSKTIDALWDGIGIKIDTIVSFMQMSSDSTESRVHIREDIHVESDELVEEFAVVFTGFRDK